MSGWSAGSGAGATSTSVATRVDTLDWQQIVADLDSFGSAKTGPLLTPAECHHLIGLYEEAALFRSTIVMARHGFGSGEYKYFADPLPALVADLRSALYANLAGTANQWAERLGHETRFPGRHAEFIGRCHAAGQTRPTPLLLRYRTGDYNCLHQDLYGEHVFPLQVAFLLSCPGIDFDGGEFVLTEQRPRMQSRADVTVLSQGEGIVFAVSHRPIQGKAGTYRVTLRHGVSRVRSGERLTMGVIFHDAA